jgi:hypothetical protein
MIREASTSAKRDEWRRNLDAIPDFDAMQKTVDGQRDLGLIQSSPDMIKYADLSMVNETAARIK